MAVGISEAVRQRVEADFPGDAEAVADILENECGDNLPFCQGPEYHGLIERVRLGVLRLSQGDVDRLLDWVALAQRDWRDILVFAQC